MIHRLIRRILCKFIYSGRVGPQIPEGLPHFYLTPIPPYPGPGHSDDE